MGTSTTSALSLGRVGPAPHTQHLLGPFAAIAQNSSLWSFSIVDSLANRQHSCRGSEELAIRKTARFQATPNYFAELRATPSYSEWGAPKNSEYSEQLRAALSHSNRKYQAPWKSQEAWYSQFLNSELLRATPSHSERLLEFSELSKRLLRATKAFRARKKLRRPPSYSELGASKNSELLRGLQAAPNTFGKLSLGPDRTFSNSQLRATGTDHDFLGKSARSCADLTFSQETFPAEHGFLSKTGTDLRGP